MTTTETQTPAGIDKQVLRNLADRLKDSRAFGNRERPSDSTGNRFVDYSSRTGIIRLECPPNEYEKQVIAAMLHEVPGGSGHEWKNIESHLEYTRERESGGSKDRQR